MEKNKRRIGDVVNQDHRKDTGEKETRIWEWWKPIFIDDTDFSCFYLDLYLIAIIQALICAIERVFSQMKKIDVCGNVYEDALEVRTFARYNGNLDRIWYQAYKD